MSANETASTDRAREIAAGLSFSWRERLRYDVRHGSVVGVEPLPSWEPQYDARVVDGLYRRDKYLPTYYPTPLAHEVAALLESEVTK